MARVNVYLPDDLAEQARQAGLNVSSITQDALRRELAGRKTNEWLARARQLPPIKVTTEEVVAAIHAEQEEMGTRNEP